jgi:hypothetical protein
MVGAVPEGGKGGERGTPLTPFAPEWDSVRVWLPGARGGPSEKDVASGDGEAGAKAETDRVRECDDGADGVAM